MSSSLLSTIKGSVVSVPDAFSWRFSSTAGSALLSPKQTHKKVENAVKSSVDTNSDWPHTCSYFLVLTDGPINLLWNPESNLKDLLFNDSFSSIR